MNSKLQQKLNKILIKHKDDKNPPKYIKSIKELLEIEYKNNEGE